MNWKRTFVRWIAGMIVIAAIGVGAIVGFTDMTLVDNTPVQDRPAPPEERAQVPSPPHRTVPDMAANQTDHDGDGLADRFERDWRSDPSSSDTDGDGVADKAEYVHGGWPRSADFDEDGLTDQREIELGTDPQYSDTDRDRLSDGEEVTATHRLPNADPLRKDLYVVLAFSETNEERLTTDEKHQLKTRFANMPVRNPDQTTGITVHYINDSPAAGVHDASFTFNGSKSHFEDAYETIMTKVREENRDDYHVVFYTDFALRAATIGKGMSTTPGHFAVVKHSAGDRVHVTRHELAHQIVGPVPERRSCEDGPYHTCRGLLSHNGETWLSWELIEQLETSGFAA